MPVERYGARWANPLVAEITAIQRGGIWEAIQPDGTWADQGLGLFEHYKRLESLLWPWKGWDRWSEKILRSLIDNRLTALIGPNSSAKTHSVAAFCVARYICFSRNSMTLVSSTDIRSLELRIWGEIKKLWNEAKLRYPETPGRIIESKQCIVTDIEDLEATDYRCGIHCIPVLVGGNFQGLSRFSGLKAERIFLASDETQFCPPGWFDGIVALQKNREFKCAALGNPKDRTDTFGRLAEPAVEVGGWEAYEPTGKTMEWPTRFPGGVAIQLDGRDTPNNDDVPCKEGEDWPFPYLINPDHIAADIKFHGSEDWHVYMNDYGIFPRDAQARRVISKLTCDRFRAFEEPSWTGENLVKLFTLDAAYGAVGGDRCIGIETCWGPCTDGKVRLAGVGQPMVIPVRASVPIEPEEQIAQWVMDYCVPKGIAPSNVAFDSTGRGSLVSAFGRIWSTDVVAIEFGGSASDRPVPTKVRNKDGQILKASEYYYNFVTELWFAWPALVESDQCRALPMGVVEEGVLRGWDYRNRKVQVEPKTADAGKPSYKARLGKSPDMADSWVVAIELARRLGFPLGDSGAKDDSIPDWLAYEAQRSKERLNRKQLVYR